MSSDHPAIEISDIGFLPAHHSVSGTTKAKPSRKLPGGKPTWGISYSSYQKRLYVAGENPGQIRVYDVRPSINNTFLYIYRPDVVFSPPLTSAMFPMFMTCGPKNHAYAYILTESTDETGSMALINTTTDRAVITPRIPPIGAWSNIAFSPDGRTSYFPNGNVLYALDEQSDAPPFPIPLTVNGYWVTVTNDGAYAYCGGGPEIIDNYTNIARVDLATRKQIDLVKNLSDTVGTFDVSFDNKKLLVSTEHNHVDIVDIDSNTKITTIEYPGGQKVDIGQIACSKVSPYACMSYESEGGTWVEVIDTVKNTKRGSLPMPDAGETATFDEYGNAYIGMDGNGVMVILHTKLETMGLASSAS